MDELQQKIVDYVEANGKTYQQIALEIHEKPEVSNYEFFASKRLADQIKSVGFEVEMPAAGHRTGFAASYKSGKPGPVMVFLAEYDALVGLGHGCGHNLFGATSSLAAAALKSVIDEVGGEVRLYGTPGEEGGDAPFTKEFCSLLPANMIKIMWYNRFLLATLLFVSAKKRIRWNFRGKEKMTRRSLQHVHGNTLYIHALVTEVLTTEL